MISLTTGLLSVAYFVLNELFNYLRKGLTSSITISSGNDIYHIVLEYLTLKGFLQQSMTQMKCQIQKKKWTWWWNRSKEDTAKPKVEYLPGPGNHIFKYKGKTLWAV